MNLMGHHTRITLTCYQGDNFYINLSKSQFKKKGFTSTRTETTNYNAYIYCL